MIPKIIHYCWLSEDKFPENIQKCIDSWKENLPDYEFILWDTKKFNLEDSIWVKEAFQSKKYAFAADYIRLYAVYNYGGIYMDTDVEVVKSFNELLHLPYFVGSEGKEIIEAGVFGAEKGVWWLKPCLEYYNGRKFIKEDGSFDTLTLPRIMMKQIGIDNSIKEMLPSIIMNSDYPKINNEVFMFPPDFFCAKNHGTGIIEKTENTFSIHHFAMSWMPKKVAFLPNIKRKMIKIVGPKPILWLIDTLKLREIRSLFISNKSDI